MSKKVIYAPLKFIDDEVKATKLTQSILESVWKKIAFLSLSSHNMPPNFLFDLCLFSFYFIINKLERCMILLFLTLLGVAKIQFFRIRPLHGLRYASIYSIGRRVKSLGIKLALRLDIHHDHDHHWVPTTYSVKICNHFWSHFNLLLLFLRHPAHSFPC